MVIGKGKRPGAASSVEQLRKKFSCKPDDVANDWLLKNFFL